MRLPIHSDMNVLSQRKQVRFLGITLGLTSGAERSWCASFFFFVMLASLTFTSQNGMSSSKSGARVALTSAYLDMMIDANIKSLALSRYLRS